MQAIVHAYYVHISEVAWRAKYMYTRNGFAFLYFADNVSRPQTLDSLNLRAFRPRVNETFSFVLRFIQHLEIVVKGKT